MLEKNAKNDLFAGVFPAGVVYADRSRTVNGDYARVGFLSFDKLELSISKDCSAQLQAAIELDASKIQALKGEPYQISTSGQTITLGYAL